MEKWKNGKMERWKYGRKIGKLEKIEGLKDGKME
jgi:hypothetical protein